MITEWKVANFKSIRQETTLGFSPLTIFAGANSSGKSAFLQSILLVAQTLAHKVTSRPVVLNGAFTPLGQFDDLCSADRDSDEGQIVIGWKVRPPPDSKVYDFYRDPEDRKDVLSSVRCEIAFDTEDSGEHKEITQVQPRLASSQLSVSVCSPKGRSQCFSMAIRAATDTSYRAKQKWIKTLKSGNDEAQAILKYDIELDKNSWKWLKKIYGERVSKDLKLVGCWPKHFLPKRLFCGTDKVAEDVQIILNIITSSFIHLPPYYRYWSLGLDLELSDLDTESTVPDPIVKFILNLVESKVSGDAYKDLSKRLQLGPKRRVSLKQLAQALDPVMSLTRLKSQHKFKSYFEIRKQLDECESKKLEKLVDKSVREKYENDLKVRSSPVPSGIGAATEYLEYFFSTKVRYLGPLRDEPKSLYPLLSTADPDDVGLKGEHTASVLELYKNLPIRYIPASAFAGAEIKLEPTESSLEDAVVDWLQYLGVAGGVKSEDKGKLGHELTVEIAGTKQPRDLTHVGVGVSQVLPILVASLLAEEDTTLIFEQPELHLHPKVQTLLADFFLSITQLGKQCVLETHSEYLINRIRLRVAAASVANNPWEKAAKVYFVERPPEGSTFREVKINEYGAVMDWPEGFFDQGQEEAEKILMAAMRKRKAKQEE